MFDYVIKRSWVEISISKVVNNLKIYQEYIQDNCEIMVVVKADAYGHGAVKIAYTLQKCGIKNFAVSNVIEAIELRTAGITGQILILGYTPVEAVEKLIEYDLTQAILSEEYAENIISTGCFIKCQYAIDTGMNRIGINADDKNMCEKAIRRVAEKLNLTGMFTHLCVADTPAENKFTNCQQSKFMDIAESVGDLQLTYVHALNSAGGLWHKDSISNLIRLGIILYGLKPDCLNSLPVGIEPVMEWKSVISMIKMVYAGETIGYGRSFKVDKDMRIATVPTGYADGYNRQLSNKGYVIIHGKKAPIVGRICMDQFMVDVTNIDCNNYDEVILIGKSGDESFTADNMAQMIGTIGYEVICDVGKRVQRIYLD